VPGGRRILGGRRGRISTQFADDTYERPVLVLEPKVVVLQLLDFLNILFHLLKLLLQVLFLFLDLLVLGFVFVLILHRLVQLPLQIAIASLIGALGKSILILGNLFIDSIN